MAVVGVVAEAEAEPQAGQAWQAEKPLYKQAHPFHLLTTN